MYKGNIYYRYTLYIYVIIKHKTVEEYNAYIKDYIDNLDDKLDELVLQNRIEGFCYETDDNLYQYIQYNDNRLDDKRKNNNESAKRRKTAFGLEADIDSAAVYYGAHRARHRTYVHIAGRGCWRAERQAFRSALRQRAHRKDSDAASSSADNTGNIGWSRTVGIRMRLPEPVCQPARHA